MTERGIWDYAQDWGTADIIGYKVEATDGRIGQVDEASIEASAAFLVVDTGPWIFGHWVMLPAGLVSDIDHDAKVVHVTCSRDRVKNAPDYGDNRRDDLDYRGSLGTYYGVPPA